MQLGSIEAIKRMVRAGLGYSIVPRMAVEQAEDRDGLRVHSLAPRLYRQLAVVMRQDKIGQRNRGNAAPAAGRALINRSGKITASKTVLQQRASLPADVALPALGSTDYSRGRARR
jgi:DNA-binding transcriptional LysR family regulator